MQIFHGNSIARKMTSMVLLASGMALGTLMAAFLVFDGVSSRARLQDRLSTLGDVVGQNSAAAINFSDSAAAVEVLQALRAEPPVVSACLYDSSGTLFAQYKREAGFGNCSPDRAHITAADPRYPTVSRPILRHGELVGDLVLSSDLTDLRTRRNNLLLVGGALLLVALGVGGFSGLLLQRRILRPVSDLVQAMRGVSASQNFAARVAISGANEIAQLGTGFNAMLSELEKRDGEKKQFEAELQRQALNDELTGLPNRRLFSDRLSHALASGIRQEQTVALLYIDLDGFKLVNDSLGHLIGDVLLVQVAKRLQSQIRKSDTLARLGGDEFTVILETLTTRKDAEQVAATLLECLARPFTIHDHEITISASIGISVFPENAADPVGLLQQADSAMYAAKRHGRNRAMCFTSEIGSLVRERMSLETQLRGAIGRGEIQVYYQPEFNLASGKLVRFEALARWFHPTLGTIPPAKFIPIAEESGMITEISTFVMEKACLEAVKWQHMSEHPIEIGVNISGIQFAREHFVEEVMEMLSRTGLSPALLQLELTERIMLSGADRCLEALTQLRAMGVSLAIDDFGTGYSSLSYLANLPFNAIKIDRSFVVEMDKGPANKAMILSLITLSHGIGMSVIVEGIEETHQFEMIKRLGGDEVQGFLMGRPNPVPASCIGLVLNADGLAVSAESVGRVNDDLLLPAQSPAGGIDRLPN